MAELDLDAIDARTNAATPGPWHGTHDEFGCVHIGDYGWCAGGPNAPEYDVDSEQGYADAEFIAHARTDLPDAVAELKRLQTTRDAMADRIARVRQVCDKHPYSVVIADVLEAIDGGPALLPGGAQ